MKCYEENEIGLGVVLGVRGEKLLTARKALLSRVLSDEKTLLLIFQVGGGMGRSQVSLSGWSQWSKVLY